MPRLRTPLSITTRAGVALLVLAVLTPAHAQNDPFAIVNVNVIPMDVERVLENQIVIVADGLVQSISSTAATTIPADMRQIDGSGQGLSVIGHIPRNFDPLVALSGGQRAVAHTEELFFTYFRGPRSTENFPASYTPDMSKLPELIRVITEHKVAFMPDLCFTFGNLMMWDDLDHLWTDPEFAYLHPNTAALWRRSNINRRAQIENFIVRDQWKYDLLQTLTLEFERAGVLQVIGTDASITGLFPGKAAHRELTELVKAGLSNFEALSIGTRNAGVFVRRYIDADARFGQVQPGQRADLVLLEANPLEDVRNARRVSGVIVNGRYVDRSTLDEQRAELRARYQSRD